MEPTAATPSMAQRQPIHQWPERRRSLKGFGGADRLDGGNGIDTVFYGDSTAGVGINLDTGRGVGGSAEGDRLISIENVFGSNFNDTIIGSTAANQLHGQEGNDVIKGGGGNDYLDGGSGNDILVRGIWARACSTAARRRYAQGDRRRRRPDRRQRHRYRRLQRHEHRRHGLADHRGPRTAISPGPTMFPTGGRGSSHRHREHQRLRRSGFPDRRRRRNVLRGRPARIISTAAAAPTSAYGGTGNDHYYVDNAGDLAWE